ncbi:MAG: DUF1822 family protein [Cyanobacteria bacterium J06642_2]
MQLSLPLPRAALEEAQRFAGQQCSEKKAAQVRLNTLAVWAVNEYLDWMGIQTDLTVGDSWNAVVRACADVADLEVLGYGRLECRAVRPGENVCYVPFEVWHERIGYEIVQIDEARQEAVMLGFLAKVTAPNVLVSELQAPERILEHLDELRRLRQPFVQLRQWLEQSFSPEWQAVEALLQPQQWASGYAFRSLTAATVATPADAGGICRAKAIDLSQLDRDCSVALVLDVRPEAERNWSVRVQVHPLQSGSCLSTGLQLEVRDEADAVFLEAHARPADDCLQMQFRGSEGEHFSVRVAASDCEAVEHFQL